MTFNSLTEYLLEHPAFLEAIDDFNNGNDKSIKNILMDIQIHAYQQTALSSSKIYGLNKWLNSADIKILIRETPPPTLDYRLPIPQQVMKVNKIVKARTRLKIMIQNQLSLFMQIA